MSNRKYICLLLCSIVCMFGLVKTALAEPSPLAYDDISTNITIGMCNQTTDDSGQPQCGTIVPLNKLTSYNDGATFDLQGTIASLPGKSYANSTIHYTIPKTFIFTKVLNHEPIYNPSNHELVGYYSVSGQTLTFEFATHNQFKGTFHASIALSPEGKEEAQKFGPGIKLNVPFVIPGTIINDKKMPDHEVDLGKMTNADEDKNPKAPIVFHPTVAIHSNYPPSNKYSSNNQQGELYYYITQDLEQMNYSTKNEFYILYDLPWRGLQWDEMEGYRWIGPAFNTFPKLQYNLRNSMPDWILISKFEDYFTGSYVTPSQAEAYKDTKLELKRVWYKVDPITGEPLMMEKEVPVFDVTHNGKPVMVKTMVPVGAVETEVGNKNPPEGFSESDPCGFVFRSYKLPWPSMVINGMFKVVDPDAYAKVDSSGKPVFNNAKYAHSYLIDPDDPDHVIPGTEDVRKGVGEAWDSAGASIHIEYGGKLKVLKWGVDENGENKKPLAGAKFALLQKRSNGSYYPVTDRWGRSLGELETNKDGVLCLRGTPLQNLSLPLTNEMILREIEAPEGYDLPSDTDTVVENITSQEQVVEVTNKKHVKRIPPPTDVRLGNDLVAVVLVGLALLGFVGIGACTIIKRYR